VLVVENLARESLLSLQDLVFLSIGHAPSAEGACFAGCGRTEISPHRVQIRWYIGIRDIGGQKTKKKGQLGFLLDTTTFLISNMS